MRNCTENLFNILLVYFSVDSTSIVIIRCIFKNTPGYAFITLLNLCFPVFKCVLFFKLLTTCVIYKTDNLHFSFFPHQSRYYSLDIPIEEKQFEISIKYLYNIQYFKIMFYYKDKSPIEKYPHLEGNLR